MMAITTKSSIRVKPRLVPNFMLGTFPENTLRRSEEEITKERERHRTGLNQDGDVVRSAKRRREIKCSFGFLGRRLPFGLVLVIHRLLVVLKEILGFLEGLGGDFDLGAVATSAASEKSECDCCGTAERKA